MESSSSSTKMEYPYPLYPRDQFNAFLNSCVQQQSCRKVSPPLKDSDIEKVQELIFKNYGYLCKRDLYERFFQEYGYELKLDQENLSAILTKSDIVETLDGTLFCRKYVRKNKGIDPVYSFTPDEKKNYDESRRKHGTSGKYTVPGEKFSPSLQETFDQELVPEPKDEEKSNFDKQKANDHGLFTPTKKRTIVKKAWSLDTPPSSDEKYDHKMRNFDHTKMFTILQNSFDGEDWFPEPIPEPVPYPVVEERIADCGKKSLEKAKRMSDEDKCKSQNLRKICTKKVKPLMNLRLEAPYPEDQEIQTLENKKSEAILQNGSGEGKSQKTGKLDHRASSGRSRGGHVVRMQGLPFRVTKNDIAEFFSYVVDVDLINIDININNIGKTTGRADVYFENEADAKKAMARDRKNLKHRYIELFYEKAKPLCNDEARGRQSKGYESGSGDLENFKENFVKTHDDWLQRVLDQGMPDEYQVEDYSRKLEQCSTPDLDLNPLDISSIHGSELGCPRGSTPIPQEVLDTCFDVLDGKNEVKMFDLTKYLEKQKILQIKIRSALSPSLFYFQMVDRTDSQILSMKDFTKKMSGYYNQYGSIPSLQFKNEDFPITGWTIACQYTSLRTNKTEWRRGKIRQKIGIRLGKRYVISRNFCYKNEKEYYEVFFFDFGIYDVVHFKKFRKLHIHFSIYPVQCLPGKLMGIREQDVNKWARSVKSYFRDFIKNAENNNLLALVGPGNYVDQKSMSSFKPMELVLINPAIGHDIHDNSTCFNLQMVSKEYGKIDGKRMGDMVSLWNWYEKTITTNIFEKETF